MTRIPNVLLFLICALSLFADSPAAPQAYVAASHHGRYYFLMKPKLGERARYGDGDGIAYQIKYDGTTSEIWRTTGWYSFEVFLSTDGRHLVRMGPWNAGHEPQPDHLAVAFYKEGKLIRQYSTAELVKDKSMIQPSVSHYTWLARDRYDERPIEDLVYRKDGPILGWDNIFRLKTVDGISYSFNVTDGEIVKSSKTSATSSSP